jgi:hypothetical protein
MRVKAGLVTRPGRSGPYSGSPTIDSGDPWDTRDSQDSQDSQDSEDSHDRPTADSDDPWGTGDSSDTGETSDTDDSRDFGFASRFAAVIDPAFALTEEAARRIERQIRQAVLAEVANIEVLGEIVVSSVLPDGSRGIVVRLVR